jgi:hypothetical protein
MAEMNGEIRMFEVVSTLDEVLDPAPEWKKLRARCMCPGCGAVQREQEPLGVDLWPAAAPEATVSGMFRGTRVLHRGFAEWLSLRGAPLICGKLVLSGGVEVDDFVSCYAPREEHVRLHRGPATKYRICEDCGLAVADSYRPPEHLVAAELKGRAIVLNDGDRIFVDQPTLMELPIRDYPDLNSNEIPVLKTPLDRVPPARS